MRVNKCDAEATCFTQLKVSADLVDTAGIDITKADAYNLELSASSTAHLHGNQRRKAGVVLTNSQFASTEIPPPVTIPGIDIINGMQAGEKDIA